MNSPPAIIVFVTDEIALKFLTQVLKIPADGRWIPIDWDMGVKSKTCLHVRPSCFRLRNVCNYAGLKKSSFCWCMNRIKTR